MKLTAKIKLTPDEWQYQSLLKTLESANAACNAVSEVAWEKRIFKHYDLHHECYHAIREQFTLSAQVAVRVLGKVADTYKKDKRTKRAFRPHGSIAYDSRILSFKLSKQTVSIWTVDGRKIIPFVAGDRQLALLQHQRGESDLVLMNKAFYLYVTCEVDDPTPFEVDDVLGVDLGVVNIAADSDGEIHQGKPVNNVRVRYSKLRRKLQKKGTKSAKRLLKKRRKREKRFVNDVNHCLSKQLVKKAECTERGIALEDLTNIRDRVRARKSQRLLLHSWSFADLQNKISYKAKRAGVPVVFVNPAYTSQTCPACGCVDKHNRKSQSEFCCVSCGHAAHADTTAAQNIRVLGRAAVNQPYAASV
jgi:IS605 OrfB family transposase